MKRYRFILSLIAIYTYAVQLQAQPRDTVYLWQDKVPGETGIKKAPLITANTQGNTLRMTDVTNPAMVVFRPDKEKDAGKGVIICPGGGYRILAIDKEGYEIAEWLNTLGMTAFVLQYRVPDKREAALNDIQRAIRYVRCNARDYALNPDQIGVLGFSAGGSLCARASTSFMTNSYEGMDHMDTLSCRPDFALLIYAAYLDLGENRSITPELQITEDTPPFFIFGTADDRHGNSSIVMAGALRDHEIPVELHLLSKGGHGYGKRAGNIAAETWPVLAEKWLQER